MISTNRSRARVAVICLAVLALTAACSAATEAGGGSVTILDVDSPSSQAAEPAETEQLATADQVEDETAPTEPEPTIAPAPAPIPVQCGIGPEPGFVESVPVNWEVGSGRRLQVTSTTSQLPGAVTTSMARVEVVEDLGVEGYVLTWTNDSVEMSGISALELATAEPFARMVEGLVIEYQVSADGFFIALLNEEDLRRVMMRSLDALIPFSGESVEAQAEMRRGMEQMISTPGFIEATAIKEVQVLHSIHGLYLELGESVAFDDFLPNAFGGDPFPATATIALAGERTEAGCADFSYITAPDSELFLEILFESMAELMGGGQPFELSEAQQAAFRDSELTSEISTIFDEGTGWPVEVETLQEVQIGGESRIETTTITALGPLDN